MSKLSDTFYLPDVLFSSLPRFLRLRFHLFLLLVPFDVMVVVTATLLLLLRLCVSHHIVRSAPSKLHCFGSATGVCVLP